MTEQAWWLARPETTLPPTEDWLTPAELGYAGSRRFTKRRVEFLTARYTAKCAAGRVLGVPDTATGLRRVEIRHEPSGAPFLCLDGSPAGLQMSLTDRAGWAVCLVADRPGSSRLRPRAGRAAQRRLRAPTSSPPPSSDSVALAAGGDAARRRRQPASGRRRRAR